MASYRPKSLNELNNLYDKSMAAQTAIKNKGSAIADSDSNDRKGHYSLTDDFSAPKEKTAAQTASDELSDALNDFMKNFGESSQEDKDKAPVRQPLPITKVVKATPPQKPKNKNKPEHPVQKVSRSSAEADKAKKEKPALMRSEERSDLLDDYMKIMNDEDDDSSPIKSIVKKKKKSKKNKHQSSPIFEDNTQSPGDEIPAEAENEVPSVIASEEAEAAEAPKDEIDEFEAFFRNDEDNFSEIQQEEPEEEDRTEENATEESEEDSEETPKAAKPKKKKSIFAQIFLMIILLAVLVSAVGVGLLKVVVGVDTGNAFADNYYVFTADEDYEKVGISKGDLIITENKDLNENEPFAYADSQNGHICFALKGSSILTDRFMAHGDGGIEFVKKEAVKGAVIRTIPQLGSVAGVLTENFIIIISVLVAVALILILVIALAFRSKPNYNIESFEDEEENAETEEEYEGYYEDDDSSDSDYEYDEVDEGESFEEDYDERKSDNSSDLFSTTD